MSRGTNACIDVQLYHEWHVTGCALLYCGTRVAGCAVCHRVVTSHWIRNGAACYKKNLWRSCYKVISVGTPDIRHIHVRILVKKLFVLDVMLFHWVNGHWCSFWNVWIWLLIDTVPSCPRTGAPSHSAAKTSKLTKNLTISES